MRLSIKKNLIAVVFLALLSAAALMAATVQTPINPGGFLEKSTSGDIRPLYTAAQVQGFLPSRGAFTFPTPYNTDAVRITNSSDCGGADCVIPS